MPNGTYIFVLTEDESNSVMKWKKLKVALLLSCAKSANVLDARITGFSFSVVLLHRVRSLFQTQVLLFFYGRGISSTENYAEGYS